MAAAYGLSAMRRRQYQPDFLYRAVMSGDADLVSAFSSDGRIARYGLNILADPKGALPPYDARASGGAGRTPMTSAFWKASAPWSGPFHLP